MDINDLTIVLAHYGQSVGTAGIGTHAGARCMALLVLGLGALLAWAARRQPQIVPANPPSVVIQTNGYLWFALESHLQAELTGNSG